MSTTPHRKERMMIKMTLESAFRLFYADRSVYCQSASLRYYSENLKKFVSFCENQGVCDVREFSQDVLKQYVLYFRQRGTKATSIHTYFRAINAFCRWMIDENIVPEFNYKIKLPRENPSVVLPLTSAEAAQIENSIIFCSADKTRDLLIFRLMLHCGLRSSEVRNLREKDVDYTKSLMTINDSKYGKSRIVPVPEDVLLLLHRQHRYSQILNKKSDNVILSGKDVLSSNAVKQFFSKLKRRSGVDRLHAHLLRHTFATSYMVHRGNLEFLRMYLGHETYAVTQNYVRMAAQCSLTNYDIYKIDDCFK